MCGLHSSVVDHVAGEYDVLLLTENAIRMVHVPDVCKGTICMRAFPFLHPTGNVVCS